MNDLSAIAKEARALMNAHGLSGWAFRFDGAVRRFGLCHYGRRTISLSRRLAQQTPLAEVRDTILHEIAHAMVGRGIGHGPLWKRAAIEIGCSPTRCYDSAVVKPVPGKWQAVCPACGHVCHMHRMPRPDAQRYHKVCGPENGRLQFARTR